MLNSLPPELPHLVRAELARRKLKHFIPFTKRDYSANWHHDRICEEVDDFIAGKTKKLLIFAPPQHGKSEITTRRTPALILGKRPATRIAIVSYSKELAMAFNRDIQRIIDDHYYTELFPGTLLPRSNVVTSSKSGYLRNNTMFETVPHRGSVRTVGVEGSLTGFPVDVAIFDDLYKNRDEAMSAKRQNLIRSFWETVLIPRLHNESQILGTFTRWSEHDLGGFLMETDTGWKVVSLPAIKDREDDADPRKLGEALWPEKHSKERLLDIQKKSPIVFLSLYQQKPQAPNEIKIYRYNLCDEIPQHLTWYYGVDFGYENDPTVIIQIAHEIVGHQKFIYVNEVLYKTKMTNGKIKEHVESRGLPLYVPFYADRDPKDIQELKLLGMNFIGAIKGKVSQGIDYVKDGVIDYDDKGNFVATRLFITRTSLNVQRDFDNYQWEVFNGKPINTPVEGNDHACFAAGTKVLTGRGDVSIESILTTDQLVTSNGLRSVNAVMNNGTRLTFKYLLHFGTFFISLRCTPDHRVKVNDEWVAISELKPGQTVSLFNTSTVESISYNRVKGILNRAIGICISTFGKRPTVDEGQKVSTYITKTTTRGTISRVICRVLTHVDTCLHTVRQTILQYLMQLDRLQNFGMVAQKVLTGTSSTQEIVTLETSRLGTVGVKCAIRNLPSVESVKSSVTRTAKLLRLDVEEPQNVQVFDLSVDTDHEYFANGVLVHNCDALRYGYKTRTQGPQTTGGGKAFG